MSRTSPTTQGTTVSERLVAFRVVLADLGFKNVRLYESSWLGYSSWLSAPADDEVWTNFGALLTAIKGLENRFGELERQTPGKLAK